MAEPQAATAVDVETPLRRFVRAYLASKLAVFGLVLLCFVLFVAVAGPLPATYGITVDGFFTTVTVIEDGYRVEWCTTLCATTPLVSS